MDGNAILVIGAGGALGREIVRRLGETGAEITATYRTPRPAIEQEISSIGAIVTQLDLTDKDRVRYLLENANAVIFTPILSIASDLADLLRDDQRAVFISSNNVAIDPDTDVYARLLKAEADIAAASPKAIILRPTMIYGYPGDGNLSSLIKAMRRFPVTPMPGSGKALQQPVNYQALARTAVAALFAPTDHPRLCAVAGPEPVTLRELYQAVARAAEARTLIAPLPVRALSRALNLIERTGIKLPVSAVQLARAGMDKTPKAEHVILTDTGLEAGLKTLVAAMAGLDEGPAGA